MANATPEKWIENLCFPESPRWHEGRFYFVDMYEGAIYCVAGNDHADVIINWDGYVSGLGRLPCGDLLFVDMMQRCVMRRLAGGDIVMHADLSELAGGLCNDMVVDRDGTAYVGNFGYDIENNAPFEKTPLISISPDGQAQWCSPPLAFPNAMVLSDDEKYLIVAETTAQRLVKFTRNTDASLSDREVVAKIESGFPDGICLDAEGCIWVAAIGEPDLIKIDQGGVVVDRVRSENQAIACMLSGGDKPQLYITTAPKGAPTEGGFPEFYRQLGAGCIERITTSVGRAGRP